MKLKCLLPHHWKHHFSGELRVPDVEKFVEEAGI